MFKSPESYYQILRESQLSWQKGNRENQGKTPEKVEEKNQEIDKILKEEKADIESGKLPVYNLEHCHLLRDDICNYLPWRAKK